MNELKRRLISAVVISLIFILSFHFEGYGFIRLYLFILFVTAMAIRELFKMFVTKVQWNLTAPAFALSFLWLSVVYGVSLSLLYEGRSIPSGLAGFTWAFSGMGPRDVFSLLAVFTVFNISFYVFYARQNEVKDYLWLSLLSFFYFAIPLSVLLLLRAMPSGAFYIWFLTWATAMTDTMGFVFGKLFGRHKVNWTVSPNKTWEGYIGGFFGQIASVFAFYYVIHYFSEIPHIAWYNILYFSIAIYFSAVLGDLSESRLKRVAGVKDSGSLIPGHGGIMDRIDSIMFSIPVFYFLLIRL